MRPFLITLTLALFFLTVSAQNVTPVFGKIEKADLEMKDCDFDKAAEAMVLFDVGEVYCNLNLNSAYNVLRTQLDRHTRIKILNKKGLDYASVRIRYITDPNIEDIKNFSAQTINLDASGNIVYTKVEKDAIYRKKINKRYSELIFTFPNVVPGSVVEYKYKDDASGLYAVKNWYFQRSIPVAFSRYILDFPYELKISAVPKGGLDIILEDAKKNMHYTKTFSMTNVPALRDEPYISCDDDYLQQVTPQILGFELPGEPYRSLVNSWANIIKDFMADEDFGIQLKKDIPRTTDLDALLLNVKDPYTKMTIIHNYVKKNMQWDGIYSIWALDGVKAAWKDKKGTAGEINLILINLLRDAGLAASPVLVSTRDNGRVNIFLADYEQFDKVMAYVTINDEVFVLDATDKFTPSNLIPYEVLNTQGLVIEKRDNYKWGWHYLSNPKQTFNDLTLINAVIDDKGNMTGAASITSKDYSRYMRMAKLKEGKAKFTEAWLNQNKQDIKVDSLQFTNEDVDTLPLIQDLNFERKINSSGDFNYFSVNLFSGLDKNPFIADERFSDVFYGATQQYAIIGNFTIPENCQFETLPKNLKMIMPDTSIVFTRMLSVSENLLSTKIILEFKSPYYLNENYDYFKEFYKKMFDLLNEQVVFKKK
jgi:Domain of Unknown Function with PDB structure (DUF3857)